MKTKKGNSKKDSFHSEGEFDTVHIFRKIKD